MVGKTFKGLTDELLAWQTSEFPKHESHRTDWTVYLRPELVVEIELDGVQVSSRYPGGVALRFARVVRYRPDKDAAEADTIDTVRAMLPAPAASAPDQLEDTPDRLKDAAERPEDAAKRLENATDGETNG